MSGAIYYVSTRGQASFTLRSLYLSWVCGCTQVVTLPVRTVIDLSNPPVYVEADSISTWRMNRKCEFSFPEPFRRVDVHPSGHKKTTGWVVLPKNGIASSFLTSSKIKNLPCVPRQDALFPCCFICAARTKETCLPKPRFRFWKPRPRSGPSPQENHDRRNHRQFGNGLPNGASID